MTKKWLVMILAVLVLALVAACGNESSAGDKTTKGADPVQTPAENKVEENSVPDKLADVENRKATVTFYLTTNNVQEETFNERYGNKLRERFPNYTIDYVMQAGSKTLPELIAAGGVVDIIITSDAFTPIFITPHELQYDITPLVKAFGTDLNQFEPSTVELQRAIAGGALWGLPFGINSGSLLYNKDIFDKFGVDYPRDGMTWDEIYTLARTMTREDGGTQYKGLVMSFQHLMYMNQYSAAYVDDDAKKAIMTAEGFEKAFLNLARFYQIPGNGLPGNKYTLASQTNAWGKDKVAAMYASLSGAPREDSGLNWDVVDLPFLVDKPGIGPQPISQYAYLTKLSKDKEAAYKVIEYLVSAEYQKFKLENGQGFSALRDPSINGSYGKGDPYLEQHNLKALLPETYAPAARKSAWQSAADKESYAALEAYLNGIDVNTALREANERLQQVIDAATK